MTAMSGLMQYWEEGDVVTHVVALLLLAMSLLSWIIALYQAWNLRGARRGVDPAIARFWRETSPEAALQTLQKTSADAWLSPLALAALFPDHAPVPVPAPAPSATVANHATSADASTGPASEAGSPAMPVPAASGSLSRPPSSLASRASHADRVTRALREVLLVLQRRIDAGQTWLATIAGAAPFVGLLGTVWGIYHALIGIAGTDQPSITAVAGPVGEALIMTALGLVVAIPALVAYNLLGRSGRLLHEVLDGFAGDLQRLSGVSRSS
ncbi:MotA/TolQ/ExbB proton channel family protein [Robbsia andropogonis]|uniref:MotA/TolQ/ExbB proton channel family protein n=1 Tax=Robbsia andropogonis TaxID=28092 RepID=UPI003D251EF5